MALRYIVKAVQRPRRESVIGSNVHDEIAAGRLRADMRCGRGCHEPFFYLTKSN
jgi:hypothetical protein